MAEARNVMSRNDDVETPAEPALDANPQKVLPSLTNPQKVLPYEGGQHLLAPRGGSTFSYFTALGR